MRLPTPRRLCFGGTLAVFALMGCGSGHPSGPPTFSWLVFDIEQGVSDPRLAIDCAAVGAGTVVVTLTDVAGATAPLQATVPCTDGVVSIADVPRGSYYADFALYGDPLIYGNSTTQLDGFRSSDADTGNPAVFSLGPGKNNSFTDTYAPFIVQSFSVSWAIYYQGVQTSCAAVPPRGASYVYLDFLVAGAASWVSSLFYCDTGNVLNYSYAIPVADAGVLLGGTAQWQLSLADLDYVDLQVIDGGTVTLPTDRNVNLAPQYFSF
jgi:hypothetical protein